MPGLRRPDLICHVEVIMRLYKYIEILCLDEHGYYFIEVAYRPKVFHNRILLGDVPLEKFQQLNLIITFHIILLRGKVFIYQL
jgi:hypothetical protein